MNRNDDWDNREGMGALSWCMAAVLGGIILTFVLVSGCCATKPAAPETRVEPDRVDRLTTLVLGLRQDVQNLHTLVQDIHRPRLPEGARRE